MISKLLIADVNVSDEMKSLLNSLKGDDVLITYYNYSQGFIVDNKNLLVDKLLTLIRSHLETSTVNFEHLCFMNVEQMKTPTHSSKYNNELHVISNVESKPDALESWNFMGKLVADIAKTTEIRNIDFIDIDHLCFPKEHAVIFDKIQEVTKDVEDRTINYLKVGEEDKETIYKSNNWLHAMMTTFYNDENKVLLDKYFKINNSNIGFLNTKILKPRNLQIYDSHVPSIDFESGTLNVSIIPLYCYASDADYDLMGDFIESLNSNTILEFIHITDTMAEFKSRMNHILDKYCGENKDKINKVNVAIWLNPNVSNPALMFSNHITANIDQELAEVVNQLTTNNTENVDQLQNHFVVQVNEAFIEYFNMNVYDNMDVNIINFEIFNISDTYNTNFNLLCHFLHNDYYVSTLVNFNLTFITSSDITDNLFELSDKIVDFDEEGNIIDLSQSLFKDSQLMTDISNNESYHDDLFISNTSHINKSIQYNNDINLATYLSSYGPEIDKFMKQNVITNVILYDRELFEHLSDVRSCLLPNTLLLTFDKQNTYQDIKDGLLRINGLNGVQISNVALFQDNDSRSKTYNFVGEETSIVKYPMMDDPSLNTWSKFQDFVLFLDTEMNVKHFDLMMCKIYSNPNWNYVIDTISSNLSSLVIRSSENNTGHTMFEGDWILESPVVDVNMINLYFKESIKELDIQLGTNVNIGDYTKIGWMKTSHRWIDNNAWSAGGPMFSVRCHTRQASDYSFTSQTPSESAYTINFDNNIDVLISPVGWSNSYNYSDTITQSNFNQKTHSQSPGNLYLAFDDESSVDENTWFIPVTAIWNGMNHSPKNFTALSHTNYWDLTDTAGYESLFGTLTTTHQTGITYNSTAYFYVGPYTAYSGIPNPVPIPITDDFTTNFFNYNSGEALASTQEKIVFTESTTAYLNYDISVAEIKEYVAPADYGQSTDDSSQIVSLDSGVYNIVVDKPEPPSPPVKYVVFQRVSDNYSRESAIGEIECVLNDNTNIALASNGATAEIYEDFSITDNVASWSTVSTFMASWTNGNYWADKAINGTTTGNFLHINHGTLLVSTVITLQDIHTLDAVQYLYVNNRQNTAYLDRITEHRFVLLDEDKNVVATTNEITVGEVDISFNYSEFNLVNSSEVVDVSSNIVVDLSTNTITSNVDFEIKYTPIDLSLSELTKDTTINPVRSQTVPFVKSNGTQEERSVTLHGDATYNRFANEYYFPGDLSGYASIEGQLFGEHAMSMSFMYKSGGEQPTIDPSRNTITYIGHPYPSPLNQNAHDTNDFAIYSSPNDQASIFYKEDDTSIKEVPSATFDNSSNYTHVAITMNEDLTLNETNGFKMYVNGVLEKSGNLSANNGALISGVAQPLQLLGKGPLSGSSESSAFKGYLKNVRFYDSVLSQSEVTTIYTNMITNEYTDNKNFVSQVVPNLVISSSDISSGEHTELTSISMEITATTDSSLNITSSDINVTNGTISNFTNNTTNTWSFDFTPASSNMESTLSISENSLLDNTINNMIDKPSWFSDYNNHASNMFKFMKTDVEMDLMPPLQDQTIAMITSNGSHIEIPVTLNGGVVYDASKNEYDISENGYLSIDEDVIRGGDLTISLMYAMRSGNQYGNDQLVNFSDSNYLDTSTNSTDIHIFRDGTTPGAWFYYGSPDDNGMAISEAGLEPSIQDISSSSIVKYTHMAITVKEGQVKQVYINGEVVDYVNKYRSNALPVSRAIVGGKRQHQLFGYGYAANRGFSGLMKNIRIYNKALTSYEMRHLYAINSNFNDNDFSNTTLIPVTRPTLTFSAPLPESKILDGNGAEMTFNSFVKNGKEYKAYSFTNTGTTSITIDRDATDVEILIVGGGGGGGFFAGGGGGAGGVVYAVNQTLTAGTYNIEVGAGGVGWRQGGGVVPTNIGGDGIYHSQSGLDSSIKQSGTPISLVNNTINAIGYGGGGGGNIINHDSGSQAAGVSGGSGGGSSGPWNNSSNNTIYTGGTATQGNTLYDISAQSYVAGGNNGNTLIGDALQTTNYKPIMGMGGGGASAIIYNDDDTDTGWSHVNGKNGIEIDIGGSTLTVAAGGGGSQMGYHPSWHGPGSGSTGMYNTNLNRGLGGSNGVGGDGMLWRTGWVQAISGKDYPAHYKRLASDGADNTGSGGGGSQPGESGSAEAYYTSGSGGSGIVIIQFPKAEVASGSSLEQSTLDLKLTVSDDGLDGNISSSDIITSNGTITAFSQSSPTTWDLTYTSDYTKQSNVGSLFIEQDTIYNRDVSDAFAPEATFSSAPTTTTVLAGGGGLNGTGGTQGTVGGSNRHRSDGIYDFTTMWNGTLNDSNDTWGSYASNGNNVSSYYLYFTFPGETVINKYFLWKRVSGTGTDESWSEHAPGTWELRGTNNISGYNDTDSSTYDVLDSRTVSKSVWDTVTLQANTNHTSSVNNLTNCLGFSFSNIQSYKTYVISVSSNVGGVGDTMHSIGEMALAADLTESSFTPPSWWTREHNKASNKFEWTALNSGASDTSTTPTRPSITFSSLDLNHGESQNLGTVSMTIYVSSNNLNVAQADLSFSNGVVSNFTKVSNNYYTFDFKSESVSQASTIQVLQDTVSNTETVTDFNEASNVFEWTWSFTVTPPEITITSTDVTHGGNFGVQEVNMLLEFSGEVLHGNSIESTFSQFDVSAVNGYVFDISVISQSQIAFKLGSSSTEGSTSVFIPQNIVSRTFNNIYTVNTNNVSNVFTWNYISANLTVSSLVVNDENGDVISGGDYINENELWLQFTFSESIFNFNKSYFDTTNCKIANISSDTTFTTFTVKVETFFPTTASVQVKTDKFITSGRGLQKYVTGANNLSFNWNYNNTKPQISMTSSQASGLTNNVGFVDLSFISTIDTSDFTESSITVTGDASLSNFTSISATEYSVRVTPNSVSNIDITVPVNAYTEQYGNGNENSVSFSWNYDNVPPTVEIFSPDIANGASSSDPYINIYFTLSKPVDDFVLNDDANVANGTMGAMTKTNTFVNHTTTFNVTVATKTASHPYNGSGSSAGYFLNGVESPTIDFIVGQTYTFDQSDSTNSTHPLKFYTTAEKDVLYTSGVVYTDSQGTSGATTTITIDENTPSPLFYQCANHGFMGYKGVVSKKESYTAKLYPTQNDTVSVYVFSNSITDSAGNQNTTDSNEFDWIFDSNDLLTTLSSSNVANNGTFSNDSITISLATTAAIVDFVEADISYQNGTISNVDSSAKTFNITSNAQGVPTTAFVIGGAVETSQGESNIESNIFSWTYNPPIPKLVIKSSQINEGDYTNISSVDFTLTFDQENVIFDQNSLSIYNGTISSFSGSGTTYQVTVDTSVVSDDLIRLTLPQGNAHVVDNGNHYNDVSYNFEWNYDSVAPSITIGSSLVTQDASSTLTSLVLTLNSSEHIDGLRLSDFDVSNGVVSDLTNEGGLEDSSGSSFTFTIQPLDDTTDCSLNICLNANSVVDRAGNTNAKSNDFGYSYIFFSRKLESSAIVELFEDDPEIPQEERLSSSEIDLVISAAFTIPDTASPFAVAENESSDTGENDSSEQTDGEAIFVKPPKITFPSAIKIKNRKVFTKLIDQIFATASESVTTLTIDKSSVAVSASAEAEIADVEEVVMVKSNQTEPVDMSALIEDPTKPSATYIPLANIGDFAIIAIDGVEYTTVVEGEGIFLLSSNNGGAIDNPNSGDGKWHSNDVYQATDINKIIFGSQIISTSPVSPDPPTLTITSGQVSGGGTTDISYIDLSFVFSTTVEISLNDIEALNANTTIISRTIVTDVSDSHIAVTIAPVDLCDNTIGVFVDVSAFYDSNNIFNDVQYTYSWNYSLDGGSSENGGTSDFIPCFLEGTKILTTKGYKNIEFLNPKKDKLLDKDNNVLNFLDIQKYSQENNGKQYPYKIPHGSALSEDYTCNRDLYLTYNHCVYLPHLNKFAPVSAMKHLKEDKSLTQKKFTYYHVFTENYFSDTLMANGIPCESHSKYTFAKLRNIDPSDKLLRSVIKKADMLPNCMRNRLSIKEMKQLVKKFNRKQNKRKIKTK